MRYLVLDTNIVLDLFVFDDPAARELKAGLRQGGLRWIATQAMRDELERVLAYPKIALRLAFYRLQPVDIMAGFDRDAVLVDAPARAAVACSDADDQKFIDLAVHHQCILLSKDAAVLSMKKRLAPLGVCAFSAVPAPSCGLSDA
jgi:putative PIN family toxin of toxin-antitoxin system